MSELRGDGDPPEKSKEKRQGLAFAQALTQDELVRLLMTCNEVPFGFMRRDAYWIRLLLLTGMTPDDLLGLNLAAVIECHLGEPVRLKSGVAMRFSRAAAREMEGLAGHAPAALIEANTDAPLIITRRGKRPTLRALQLRLDKIAEMAGISPARLTLNNLIATHRAADVARRFAWTLAVWSDLEVND